MNHKLLIAILALGMFSVQSHAGINDRQERQQERINHGIANGELTGREAARMQRQQNKIDRKEQAYRSDGVLTKRERIDLRTDLNQTSRRIYKQKHDGQTQ